MTCSVDICIIVSDECPFVFLTEGWVIAFCKNRLVGHSIETFIQGKFCMCFLIPFSGSVLKYHIKCMLKLSPVLSLARLNYYYFTLGPLRLTHARICCLIPLLFSVTQWDIIENELLGP